MPNGDGGYRSCKKCRRSQQPLSCKCVNFVVEEIMGCPDREKIIACVGDEITRRLKEELKKLRAVRLTSTSTKSKLGKLLKDFDDRRLPTKVELNKLSKLVGELPASR